MSRANLLKMMGAMPQAPAPEMPKGGNSNMKQGPSISVSKRKKG
jgi:hypothetical protein